MFIFKVSQGNDLVKAKFDILEKYLFTIFPFFGVVKSKYISALRQHFVVLSGSYVLWGEVRNPAES